MRIQFEPVEPFSLTFLAAKALDVTYRLHKLFGALDVCLLFFETLLSLNIYRRTVTEVKLQEARVIVFLSIAELYLTQLAAFFPRVHLYGY